MADHKVIIDTCVLIAASISHACTEIGGRTIEDSFYKISNPLFEYFRKNIDKHIGIVTQEIENSARDRMENVVLNAIARIIRISKRELKNNVRNYSITLIFINDALNKNINLLTRIPVNEEEISKIYNRVSFFYKDLTKKLFAKDPYKNVKKITRKAGRFGSLIHPFALRDERLNFIAYTKLIKKFQMYPPDLRDQRILSQAIYLKERKIFLDACICIASTDYHLSKIRFNDGSLSTFVPDEIENRLHIKCGPPDEILELLIKG